MADRALRMELRLLRAALFVDRGGVGLAVLAVAIGASVASALLHVSGDISRRLAHELRALGPNVLVLPAGLSEPESPQGGAPGAFLDPRSVSERLARAGLDAAPVLYAVARVRGEPVVLVGADLAAARRLHPRWRIGTGDQGSLVGARLMTRLHLAPGDRVEVEIPGAKREWLVAGARLEAGGADDESWWLPLADVQRLAGLEGRASLFQGRVEGDARAVEALEARLGASSDLRVVPIRSLTAAESQLLERMRRLMALVTLAALLSAGVCAFGTLADRVLERRRDFALLKALGAGRRRILRLFAAEALAIGLAGGILGWLFGLGMAQVIGARVFHTAIAVRWTVPAAVVGLAVLVAAVSSVGPARMALAVEPATVLKGD